jgi:hypothetical protein
MKPREVEIPVGAAMLHGTLEVSPTLPIACVPAASSGPLPLAAGRVGFVLQTPGYKYFDNLVSTLTPDPPETCGDNQTSEIFA